MKKKYIFFYERLSREDGDDESCSIVNQRRILQGFYKENSEFADYEVEEFIDDGYTGTNFDRPSFQRMMSKIRSLYGNIIVIVTKDFSRLGRDTIDTVNYLEKIFPFLEVRYIARNDDYDSKDYPYGLDFESKFKNLINGIYPLQMSYTQKKMKMEEARQGKHNGPVPLYGFRYTIDREYEVDWEAATVVQMIMDLLEERKSFKFIIRYLAERKIEPPSVYLTRKYGVKLTRVSKTLVWNRMTILKLARNKAYLGYSVRHKVDTYVPGTKKAHNVCRDQQILVPDRQPAIIRLEQFTNINEWLDERAEKLNHGNAGQQRMQRISALYKKVYCKNCGHALTRRKDGNYDVYICIDRRENPLSTCSFEPIETAILEAAVLNTLQFNMRLFTNCKNKMMQFLKDNTGGVQEEAAHYQASIEMMSHQKINLYGEYKSGHLTKEEYIKKKEELSEKINVLNERITAIEDNINKCDESNFIFNSEYARLVEKYKCENALTFELVDAFIDKVVVDINHNIQIIFNFQDEINKSFLLLE